MRLSTTILCVNDLLLDPPWKALIQGFHFSFGSVSLMIMISLFYRVFSLSVIDSELHGEINILES